MSYIAYKSIKASTYMNCRPVNVSEIGIVTQKKRYYLNIQDNIGATKEPAFLSW